jgi:pimeloyl-ACP methyl ester carboxylesterase
VRLEVPVEVGDGPAVVLLHGFAMRPQTYDGLVGLLAQHCHVYVPDLFAFAGQWSYRRVLDAFIETMDDIGLERVSLIGHSFGGSIELGFAAEYPHRVVELVFSDTLAVSREWGLAAEAMRHPLGLLRLATPTAASAFAYTWWHHPRQLVDAAWWGFTSGREHDAVAIAEAGLPAHVLWANRDSILSRPDGRRFAKDMAATFTVAAGPGGMTVDHDWMFQEPQLFYDHLNALGLAALST